MYTTRKNHRHNADLFPQVDRVLNEIFNTSLSHFADEGKLGYTHPSANVREFKDKFIIEFAIPGMEKSDVSIKVDKDVLIVSADKEADKEIKYRLAEFRYGKFSRKFKLPKSVDTGAIEADLINGVLSITIGKKEEAVDHGPKEIKIS